ncbi:MAG: alcohol dehydrogenase catalytic domain-containing protein [Planctomycetes bacterium]|nr:alcohol dehydrogenase catalytic domain-containing protein [Planctomycetota bacterium]
MKAMLLSEYRRLSLTDMPVPVIGEEDVLVRVRACGICGSDIHGYDGSTGRRIPPLVMGHEAAGVIEAVGSQVSEFKPGDRVTFDSTVYCGKCRYCRRGDVNLCDNRRVLGVSCGDYRQHGAFAEFVAVPRHIVYRLPDELSFEKAAMIEAVSVAVHAVNRTPIKLGDTAVVVGSGMIGLLVIQAARLAGCGRIIAIDLDDDRLKLAKQLGADEVVNAKTQTPPVDVADVAFEVVGATATIKTAIAALHKGGALTLVGNVSPNVELPLQQVVTRELRLSGTCASSGEYPACIDLLARGAIDVSSMITAVAPLEEGPSWFDRLYAHEPGLMKVILQP